MSVRAVGNGRRAVRRTVSAVLAFALALHAFLGAALHAGAHARALGDGVWIHVCSVEGDRYVLIGADSHDHGDGHAEGPRHCPMCLAKAVAAPVPGAPLPSAAALPAAAAPACTEAAPRRDAQAHLRPPPLGPPSTS